MESKSKASQKNKTKNEKTSDKKSLSSKSSPILKKADSSSSKSKPVKTKSEKSFSLDRDIHEVIAREWQTAFDAVTDAICLLDRNQRILRSNRAMQDLFAVSGKKIIGKYCWEIIHKTAKPLPNCPIIKSKKSLKPERMELKVKERTLNATAYPVFNEKSKVVIGFVHIINDVTELKRAEEIIKGSEKRLKAQYQGSPLAIFTWQKQDKDFVLIDFNKVAVALSHGLVKKFIHQTARQLYKKRPDILKNMRDCFTKKTTSTKELLSEHFIPGKHIKAAYTFVPPDLVMVHIEDITKRKQTEESLAESERRYRLLAEKMSDIVWIMDMNLKTTYVSPSIQKMLGFSQKERLRQPVEEQLTPDSLAAAKETLLSELSLDKQGKGNLERNLTLILEFYHKDGSTRWLETTINGLRDEQGILTGLHGVSRDITERKRAEEKLARSEKIFSSIFHFSPDSMAISDTYTGRFIDVNQAFTRWTGYSREEVIGISALDLNLWVNPHDRDKVTNTLIKEGEVYGQEVLMRQKSGNVCNILFSARLIELDQKRYLLSLAHDISERMMAEEDLRMSEERFRLLSEATFEAIVIHEEGVLLNANDQYFKMFGYEPDEVMGKEMISKNFAPEVVAFVKKQISSNSLGAYETIGLKKDGTRFPIEIRVRMMEYKGRIVRFGAIRDISERKHTEQALQESKEKYRCWPINRSWECLLFRTV